MTRIATAILSALLTTAIPTTVQAGNVDNGDYAINYWTNYAIYPLRCVNYNSQDQIMFSMYEKSYNHCSDSPMGTYVTSVENYINGYIQQMEANAMDGGSEYTYPDMADYVNCTYGEINGAGYYMQVGCNPNSPVGLSVNVYSDEACSSPVSSSIDTSSVPNDLSLNYKKCTPCVIWMDKNDDEIDDGYYENKQQNAPLCNAAWNYKAICDGKCQAMAREQKVREGWNKADKVLLTVLSLFGEYRKSQLSVYYIMLLASNFNTTNMTTHNRLWNAPNNHQKAPKNVQQRHTTRTSGHLRRRPTANPHPWHLCLTHPNHRDVCFIGIEEDYLGFAPAT
jgi:hypothetical protein